MAERVFVQETIGLLPVQPVFSGQVIPCRLRVFLSIGGVRVDDCRGPGMVKIQERSDHSVKPVNENVARLFDTKGQVLVLFNEIAQEIGHKGLAREFTNRCIILRIKQHGRVRLARRDARNAVSKKIFPGTLLVYGNLIVRLMLLCNSPVRLDGNLMYILVVIQKKTIRVHGNPFPARSESLLIHGHEWEAAGIIRFRYLEHVPLSDRQANSMLGVHVPHGRMRIRHPIDLV